MARNRIRLPWTHGWFTAGRDASFFEEGTGRRSSPSSQAYFFSPVEEAQSHARWNRALLREKFRGPVSGTEQAAFGISAAAVAALADFDEEPRREGPFDETHVAAVASGASLPIKDGKAAALGQGEKATAKGAYSAHPFLETAGEDPFSNPVSNRADGGVGAGARRMAARGSGAPLESRIPGAERGDTVAARKAESAPGEARAPGVPEGAPVIRGPAEANAIGVAAAAFIEVAPEEAREVVNATAPKAANAAKADGARVPADAAAAAKAKDAPSAAAAKADERRIAVEEARGGEQAEGLPASVAEAKANAGRSGEAPGGRAKTNDAVVEQIECGAERAADEEAGPANVKDVPSIGGTASGSDVKPAKTIAPTKEVEVVKAEPAARSAEAATGAKGKDSPSLAEAKVDARRDHAEALEQTQAKFAAATVLTDGIPAFGAAAALDRVKADEPTFAAKLDGAKGLAAGTVAQAKASDVAVAAKLDGGKGLADAIIRQVNAGEAATLGAKAAAQHAGPTDAPAAQAKAAEVASQGAKAAPSTGPADASAIHAKAADVAVHGAKANAQYAGLTDAPVGQAKAAEPASQGAKAAEVSAHGTKAPAQSFGLAVDVLSGPVKGAEGVAAGAKAATQHAGLADAPVAPAKTAEVVALGAKTKSEFGGQPTDAASQQVKAKDVAGIKADVAHDQAQAPGQAKAAPSIVETRTGQGQTPIEASSQTTSKNAPIVEAKSPDQARDPKDAAGVEGKADPGVVQVKVPEPAKVVTAMGESRTEQVKSLAEPIGEAKPKDAPTPVTGTKPDTGQQVAEAPPQQAKAKDPTAVVVEVKAEQTIQPAETALPQPKAKDAPVVVFETKVEQAKSSAEPVADAKAKDVPVPVAGSKADAGQQAAEAAYPQARSKDATVVAVEAKAEQAMRLEGPPEPAKLKEATIAVVESKTEAVVGSVEKTAPAQGVLPLVEVNAVESRPPVEPPVQAKNAQTVVETKTDLNARTVEAPVEKAKDVAVVVNTEPAPQSKDAAVVAASGVLAGSPATDTINLHVADFPPAPGGVSPESGPYTLPAANPVPQVLPAAASQVEVPTGAALAKGLGQAAAPVVPVAVPSDPTMAFTFGFGEKGGSADAVRVAPAGTDRAPAAGDATAHGVAKAGQPPLSDATSGEPVNGVVLGQGAMPGPESAEALALGQALGPFVRPISDAAFVPRAGQVPDMPALEVPSHLPPTDVVLL